MVKARGGYGVRCGRQDAHGVRYLRSRNAEASRRLLVSRKDLGFPPIRQLIFVAADVFGLGILDVSNAAAPVLRGSSKTPGQAKNVSVSGTTAFVADHLSGMDIVDVSNPAKPVLLRSVFLTALLA